MRNQMLVVELVEPVPVARAAAVAALASQHLGIPEGRVRKLLEARVGPITRALRPEKAELIAEAFEAAGARVVVRLAEPEELEGSDVAEEAPRNRVTIRPAGFGSASEWGFDEAAASWSGAPGAGAAAGEGWGVRGTGQGAYVDPQGEYFDDGDDVEEAFDPLASHPLEAGAAQAGERTVGAREPEVVQPPDAFADTGVVSVADAEVLEWEDVEGEDAHGYAEVEDANDDPLVEVGSEADDDPDPANVDEVGEAARPDEDAAAEDADSRDDAWGEAGPEDAVAAKGESAAAGDSPRHVPPPLPWIPRAERAKVESAAPLSSETGFGESDLGDDDFDFSNQRPTRLARPEADDAAVYREIWDDPAARQRRRTLLAALLVVGIFVLIGLQWYQANGVGQPFAATMGGGVSAPETSIEVLPPDR
jgi:hypothetical protein